LLCHGHWTILWQGQPLTLPESRREKDMGTWAIYSIIGAFFISEIQLTII
jgi:hypothetical protein